MRFTQVLFKHNLLRRFKDHWKVQGKRVLIENHGVKNLPSLGISVVDMKEVLEEKREFVKYDLLYLAPRPVPFDENHPLYHARVCHKYENHSALLRGLDQAKCITKTVEVKQGLPSQVEDLIGLDEIANQDLLVQRSIYASHLFDAEQKKLPKLFDPERPAWNFRRVYGITHKRRCELMCEKLIQLSYPLFLSRMLAMNDNHSTVLIEVNKNLILFDVNLDLVLVSSVPLKTVASPLDEEQARETALPDLAPVKETISLQKTHFYDPTLVSPVTVQSRFSNIHTVFIHYDETEVQNLYETPVQETQILGRILMQTFAAAASEAKQKFGDINAELPSPIIVQGIQTDGRVFDFAVFQLNTLNLKDSEDRKNILWLLPRQELFKECCYKDGIPSLEGYNPEVFKTVLAMCANC